MSSVILSATICSQIVEASFDPILPISIISRAFVDAHNMQSLLNLSIAPSSSEYATLSSLICVFTPSGYYSSTLLFNVVSTSSFDVCLGIDWMSATQARFYDNALLDPLPNDHFSPSHTWIPSVQPFPIPSEPTSSLQCTSTAAKLLDILFGEHGAMFKDPSDAAHIQCLAFSHGIIPCDSTRRTLELLVTHLFNADCLASEGVECMQHQSTVFSANDLQAEMTLQLMAILRRSSFSRYIFTILANALRLRLQGISIVLSQAEFLLTPFLCCADGRRPTASILLHMLEVRANSFFSQSFTQPTNCLSRLDRKSKEDLLALALAHSIPVATSTTRSDLCHAFIEHILLGQCAALKGSLCREFVSQHSCSNSDRSFQTWIIRSILPHIPGLVLREAIDILHLPVSSTASSTVLRKAMKSYLTRARMREQREINSHTRQHFYDAQADAFDTYCQQWPQIPSIDVKDACISQFRKLTSTTALMEKPCACCMRLTRRCDLQSVPISDIDLDLLKCPSDLAHIPFFYHSELPSGTLLHAPSVLVKDNTLHCSLCASCFSNLRSHQLPALAVSNKLLLGNVPPQLSDLSVAEESMIALCRAKSMIFQLHTHRQGSTSATLPNSQRAMKGHIIIHPQQPGPLMSILPPPVAEVSSPICVVFIGEHMPSHEWFVNNAKPLVVRHEKVYNALQWLKLNNPLYRDITIDSASLAEYPDNDILPVQIEHVASTTVIEQTTSRYDETSSSSPAENIPFDRVVVADIDGHEPAHILRAAALRHLKERQGFFLAIPHDPDPVNEFNNPDLFPRLYPTLFPYGVGGFEDAVRPVPLSLKRQVCSHIFNTVTASD